MDMAERSAVTEDAEEATPGSFRHVLALIRPLFDAALYRRTYADVSGDPEDLLAHFCGPGWKEGRNPHAGFDTVSYLQAHADVAESGLNPFYHYVLAGQAENRMIVPAFVPEEVAQRAFGHNPGDWVDLLRPLVDEAFYTAQLHPTFDGTFDPVAHFCYRGWLEGLDPNRDFSVMQALSDNPALLHGRVNPLLQSLVHPPPPPEAPPDTDDGTLQFTRFPREALFGYPGRAERLLASARPKPAGSHRARDYTELEEQVICGSLDAAYYLAMNPDVAQAGVDPVRHFCGAGWRERRNPAPWFDTAYYLDANQDVDALGLNPLWHYIVAGQAEGRSPARPGGYRRAVIDAAADPDQITRNYVREAPVKLLGRTRLEKLLRAACVSSNGLVLSFSHDCYIRVTGGIQLFIADEQVNFAAQGVAYLNVSPFTPLLRLAEAGDRGMPVNLVLNGTFIGTASNADLAAVLQKLPPLADERRIFVAHCLLGHHIGDLIDLHAALAATRALFWVHDYSSVCAGYTLLRNDLAFCRAPPPDSVSCRVCVYGGRRPEHLGQVRALFDAVAFHVVAPSQAALDVWLAHAGLPYLSARAHEHCDLVALPTLPARRPADRPVRLAYIGYPRPHKGWPIWLELVGRTSHLGAYEFLHIGNPGTDSGARGLQHYDASTSADEPDAMVQAIARLEVDLVLALSTWPETFSYVAYEALAAGADLVCLGDSGNIAAAALRRRRGVVAADEESLLGFFESLRAVEYVRLCREQGTPVSELVRDGTSASLDLTA